MGLTSCRWITIAGTLTRWRRGAQPALRQLPRCWRTRPRQTSVGRAQRPVVSQVVGVRPAGIRIALLVRVQSVVATPASWLAADSTRPDQVPVARGALDLVPPDPDHDHDNERGEVNQGDENDQHRQTAAHIPLPSSPGTTGPRDVLLRLHHAI